MSPTRDGELLSHRELKLGDSPGPAMVIGEAELSAAFDFFDMSGQGRITANDLQQRLGAFYKNLPVKSQLLIAAQSGLKYESC